MLVAVVCGVAAAPASANWTTYRADAARSGIDPSSGAQVPFSSAWKSPVLQGTVWGQPLVDNGVVFTGTEGDQVYALNESTGAIMWQASAGTPVPSSMLPCGDISPTVGITSTPVIDEATQRIFVVADTLTGSTIQHRLYAFNMSNGILVSGYPRSVEPPGDTPSAQLQRPALALDDGEIVIGYGGNDGDCGSYNGWLVGASESGGALKTFEVETGSREGAIWGAGDGPAVDAAGNIWAASGNGNQSTFNYQESVLDLAPSLGLISYWAPSNWSYLDQNDIDLGSTEPLLLPDGLVFQIGKAGVGYLLNASALGGENAPPRFSASVCSGSYGGAIYYGGVIYVACSDGLRALSLNTTNGSFSNLSTWHFPSSVNGPPIESGGLIWATNWNGATLYGLSPQSGQPVVAQSTPSMEHFTTPSASDGKLFLATGNTVEAYTAATSLRPTVSSLSPSSGRSAGGTHVTITGANFTGTTAVDFGAAPAPQFTVTSGGVVTATAPAGSGTVDVTVRTPSGTSATSSADRFTYVLPPRCTLRKSGASRVALKYVKRRHGKGLRLAYGRLALSARCTQGVAALAGGTVTESTRVHRRTRRKLFRLRAVHLTLRAGRAKTFRVRIPLSLVRALQHHASESARLNLAGNSTGGTGHSTLRVRRLRLARAIAKGPRQRVGSAQGAPR
jgi:polyvinyl alcohol dehydrogenase (cytochrome)